MNGKWKVIISRKEMNYIQNCTDGELISGKSPIKLDQKLELLRELNDGAGFRAIYRWNRLVRTND